MSTQHTPGPWSTKAGAEPVFVPLKSVYCERLGFQIGFVNTHKESLEGEAQANARLIAAAPQMFAEIEREYTELADVHNDWPGRHTSAGQLKLCRLRNLIAQVTGREEQDVQDDYGTRALRTRSAS